MSSKRTKLQEDTHFRVLRLLNENPEMSQRELAAAVGVSVGGMHYVLNALIEKGLVKLGNFTAAEDKRRYPRAVPQPMREDALLTGVLEPTNEPYAIAKIAGIKLCESYNRQHGTDYRSVMPTNLYGPGDNFHPENSHVLPALIRRFHEAAQSEAKEVVIWGSGAPRREFLHVDDMAAASLFVLDLPKADYEANTQPMLSHINVGSGTDISILELAEKVAAVTGYKGRIVTDPSKPDGTLRKLMDVSRLTQMGWSVQIGLDQGLAATYQWFLANSDTFRR